MHLFRQFYNLKFIHLKVKARKVHNILNVNSVYGENQSETKTADENGALRETLPEFYDNLNILKQNSNIKLSVYFLKLMF